MSTQRLFMPFKWEVKIYDSPNHQNKETQFLPWRIYTGIWDVLKIIKLKNVSNLIVVSSFFLLPSLSKTQKINPSKKPFGPMDQPSHHLAVAASRWCIAQWKVDGPASHHQVMPPRRLPWRMAADEGPTTKEMAGRCFKRLRSWGMISSWGVHDPWGK